MPYNQLRHLLRGLELVSELVQVVCFYVEEQVALRPLSDYSRETVAEALLCDGFLIPKMDCLKMLNIKYEG